jgi:hypothetical protein
VKDIEQTAREILTTLQKIHHEGGIQESKFSPNSKLISLITSVLQFHGLSLFFSCHEVVKYTLAECQPKVAHVLFIFNKLCQV